MRDPIRPASASRLVIPAAWVAAALCALPAVSLAREPGVTPPPRRPKPAPQKAAEAPAKPAPAPKPEVPAVPDVPADGPLSRSELIQLAIQANPDFWRFRGEIAFYLQAEAAAYDWRDPELRIGLDHEFDADLPAPYQESSSINTYEKGYFDTQSNTFFTQNDGSGDFEGIFSGTQSQTETTSQNRQITTERVRKISPGKYQDVIDTTVYEVERRSETSNQNERGPGTASETSRTNEYSRRKVLSRSREYRNHPDDVYGDDQFIIQGRFFIPNPWEVKAKAARARAEADLSSKRLRTEVRNLVFDVGRRYDELQFRHAWHQANLQLLDLMQRNFKVVEEDAKRLSALAAASGVAGLYDPEEVPKARLEIGKAREEVFDSGRELALVREELGLLCGLDDPGRILLTNSLRLRKIAEDKLDPPSLIELARASRPDLGEMKARSDIERARLREVKALRIPWINDLRLGYGQTTSDGYREQDELTALLSISVPLFSPWQNKAHRQHEDAIASFEQAQTVLGQRIDSQVTFAVRAIRDANNALADFSQSEKLLREDLKKNDADAAAAGDKAARIKLASEESLIKNSRGRLQALYHYNQAVAHLELALGLPIEEAFAPSPKAPSK